MAKVLHVVSQEVALLCREGDPVLPESGEHRVQAGNVRIGIGGEDDGVV